MVDLTCPMTTEALKLDVHVQGDEFLNFKNFVVVYRVYFRLMSSNLNTRFLNPLPSNSQETILLQIEDDKPTVFTPKALKWDEITIPDVIELQEPQPSAQIERRDIDQIIEEPDGKVILKFRSLSQREDPSHPGPSNFRRSFSEFSSQIGNLDHSQRYRFRSPIPEQIIDPPSPTSSGIGNTINVLTNANFTIDWSTLKNDYYSDTNAILRKWFEVFDFQLREHIKKEWIADMECLHVSIPFFLWFPTFTSKYGLPSVYSQPSLNVQTTFARVWHLVTGDSVATVHPPVADLTFLLKDVSILATPFRKGREGDTLVTCTDLQKVHQQLNYTNTVITTIASQLNHVANRVEVTKTQHPSTSKTNENYANNISKPFFKVKSVPRKDQDDFTTAFSNAALLKQISQ